MAELVCNVEWHFDNLEKHELLNNDVFKESLRQMYMLGRRDCCDIFNSKIEEVNKLWNETGKPSSFGEFLEDINPEYTKFINDRIQPEIDIYNAKEYEINPFGLEFYLDDISDIRARLRMLRDIDIWITLSNVHYV